MILNFLFCGVVLALINYYLFESNKRIINFIINLLFFTSIFNIISLTFLKYVFRRTGIFIAALKVNCISIPYIIFTLLLGLLFILIKAVIDKKIIFEYDCSKISFKTACKTILSIILFSLGTGFILFSIWFIRYFDELTPNQFLFNLGSPVFGSKTEALHEYIKCSGLQTAFIISLFIIAVTFSYNIFYKMNSRQRLIFSSKCIKPLTFILSIIVFVTGIVYGSIKLHLTEVASAYSDGTTFFEDNYVDPRKVNLQFPSKKRNIIHIYLESIENSYLSKELGGYMDENIMPELTELAGEGITFSDSSKPFGGPYQTYGSYNSIAGITSISTGIPLLLPINGNGYGESGHFFPGAVTLGDVLGTEGYNQSAMFGCDSKFGGIKTLLETHGIPDITDYYTAKEKGYLNEEYCVWMGFDDDILYKFAKNRITSLYEEGKPFNFVMETGDTHFPDGYVSENNHVDKFDSQYANVIAYSTKQTVEFVRWIQSQPFYDNTTIVITGDHTSMDENFFKDFDPSYRRSIFNLILNSPVTSDYTNNRAYAPFDFYPTILASMGVKIEGDRLGLGTNLFSGKQTLVEKQGYDNVDNGLRSWSNFYIRNIINEHKNHKLSTKNISEY